MFKPMLLVVVLVTAIAIAAIAMAGQTSDSHDAAVGPTGSTGTSGPTGATRAAPKGARVKLLKSRFGRMLVDGKGLSLYLYDFEKTKRSRCYGACAKAWPPLITKGKPRAGKGIKSRLLGTTKRRDGKRQVTYRGHPLYYYEHEDEPGEVLCHNVFEFKGFWRVVGKNGNALP